MYYERTNERMGGWMGHTYLTAMDHARAASPRPTGDDRGASQCAVPYVEQVHFRRSVRSLQ